MKRDMELVRQILLQIESSTGDDFANIQIENYSPEEIAYHVYLLKDAGLIEAEISYSMDSVKPEDYVIFRMTWAGHDFLDASRDEGLWKKAMGIIGEQVKSAPFDVIKTILVKMIELQLCQAIM
ncbi:hypothetical protein L21_2529 [Methanoculleus chikugoensis]|uniref:DUF2513 domain-containing protein n=1 Tax=Methanoculleus chikugoensis TaxID=118126 RepID=A0A1M4MNT4_9EURY|nr:DUF2513 domain-containing protein [Methanoculleus chikugoensis]SCL76594.1 hypothetical protein L21_2529 [Methanoculleus chikugoensis]